MRLLVAADFVPQNRIKTLILDEDYHFFDEIKKWTERVDYSILNLEAPLFDGNTKDAIKKLGPIYVLQRIL